MPATRAELLARIDALEEARMRGVRSVHDESGERVDFASDREMASALASARRQLASAGARPITTIRFITSKGL